MITTQRLLVRKFTPEDYKDLYAYLSLAETYIYEPGEPMDLKSAKRTARERAESDCFYAVELQSENKMIGHLYFQQSEQQELMTWELGYIFHPKYQNKGYATESAKALLIYAFENLHAHRVIAQSNPENIGSWRVLEKIGMQKEGYLRQNIFFRKNEAGQPIWQDTLEYGILASDGRNRE